MTKPKIWQCPFCHHVLPPTPRLRVLGRRLPPRLPAREDSWTPLVGRALVGRSGPVDVDEVLRAMDLPLTRAHQSRVGKILLELGRTKVRRVMEGKGVREGARRWVYVDPNEPGAVERPAPGAAGVPAPGAVERLAPGAAERPAPGGAAPDDEESESAQQAADPAAPAPEYRLVAIPATATIEAVSRRAPRDPELLDRVSRWLLDVGDTPVQVDEILAGLDLEHSHSMKSRVGGLLVKHLERRRVQRTLHGMRCVVYERKLPNGATS